MAFNLNKNDDSASKVDLSKKSNSSSKFDLTKNDSSVVKNEEKPNKPKIWPFALIGLLIVAAGFYFFNSNSKSKDSALIDSNPLSKVSDTASLPTTSSQIPATPSSDTSSVTAVVENTTNSNSTESNNEITSNNESNVSNKKSKAEIEKNISTANPTLNASSQSTKTNLNANISQSNLNNKIPASFDKASASLINVDNSLVQSIISFLEKKPNSKLEVNGYASSEGDLVINQQLSQSRAEAFKKYLISKGITENRIIANGKGIDNPIESNDTEVGRIKNRRVEVIFQ